MAFRPNFINIVVLALVIGSATWAVACGGGGAKQSDVDALKQQVSALPNADAVNKVVTDKMDKPVGTGANADGNAALWKIQPGLGTVMIEYNTRMANAWYAAQAGNWDMTSYQFLEMLEIQEVGETTRPGRVEDLKKFETDALTPLMDAAKAKDLKAFNDQYPRTLNGCNSCHKKSTSADFKNGYGFVKIIPPPLAATQDIDWKGQ